MKTVYLCLAIAGTLLPYGAFAPWLIEHGMDAAALVELASVNAISIGAWLDVIVVACTLVVFIIVDGAKHNVGYRYLSVFGTFVIGPSCGLPLYLYLKEHQRDKNSHSSENIANAI